jgi:hypothetical protein
VASKCLVSGDEKMFELMDELLDKTSQIGLMGILGQKKARVYFPSQPIFFFFHAVPTLEKK